MDLSDKAIEKLVIRMKEIFPKRDDHAELEKIVNEIADVVNKHIDKLDQIGSKTDFEDMLERSPKFSTFTTEHDHIKQVIEKNFDVKI
jgi:hypothetical protein